MEEIGIPTLLSLLSAAGVIVALVSNLRGMRVRDEQKAADLSEMRSDIKHIRGQVDKTEMVMTEVRKQLDVVKDRVTRVEESTKNAHRRMDKREESGGYVCRESCS